MPIDKYFGGHGKQVMAAMKKTYGAKAKNVFYAKSNKDKSASKGPRKSAGK